MSTIAPLGDGELGPVAEMISTRQLDPTSHVTYLGCDAPGIAGELAGYDRWRERLLVARDGDGTVTGALLADLDEARRRAWWVGPWTREPGDTALATALIDRQLERFGGAIDEQELAPDERNVWLCTLAEARGFKLETPSAVFSLELHAAPDGPDGATPARSLPLREADREAVAALHDALFPGTHTTSATLVTAARTDVRVIHLDGRVAGYVATELQPDGTGYVDFIGVADEARRRGLGSQLMRDVLGDMAVRGVPAVHLTVRVDKPGARSLYAGLGFTEERVIAPYRLGFSLT